MTEFRLLGPVEVWAAGQAVDAGQPRQRSVLAALLVDAGRLVTWETLIDRVWGEAPPQRARHALYSHIARIRQVLNQAAGPGETPVRLARRAGGYILEADRDQVDVHRFTRMVQQARERDCADAERATMLRDALKLWRGEPLTGLKGPWATRVRDTWRQRRLDAVVAWAQAELKIGSSSAVIEALTDLLGEYPLVEPLTAMLMRALHAAGRSAEALDWYARTRQRLADELGLEPGVELREAQLRVLRQQVPTALGAAAPRGPTALDAADQPDVAARHLTLRPRQLPPAVADFVGRETHVHELCDLLAANRLAAGRLAGPLVLAGMGGVGKTTLAVHVSHKMAHWFPDGQLYVDLRGTQAHPADPPDVLSRFLRALGVDGSAVPDGLDDRAALYRTHTADKRLLVVLDNASSETQVEELLPTGGSCRVLVTSRNRLTGLAGEHFVQLDVLPADRAAELLGSIAGVPRVAADPEAARDIVRLCGNLPLAIRVCGARLAARPHWTLTDLARRLSDQQRRLDELSHANLQVRGSFALSYQALDAVTRRLFRLLGLIEAPDLATWVAAALLDTSIHEAEQLVDRLVGAHLLESAALDAAGQTRYRFHDLVYTYAQEQASAEEPRAEQDAALGRAFGALLVLAEHAHRESYGDDYFNLHGSAPRWRLDDAQVRRLIADPLTWMETERLSMVAAIRQSARRGMDELCWDLAVTAGLLFATRGYYEDWRLTHQWALEATRKAGNRRGEAMIMEDLGSLYLYENRYDEALAMIEPALRMFDEQGEWLGHTFTLIDLAIIERRRSRFMSALHHFEQASQALQRIGDRLTTSYVRRNIGQIQLDLGRPEKARRHFGETLAIAQALGATRDEAQALICLGEAHLALHELAAAEHTFEQAVRMMRQLGDRIGEAAALSGLGRLCLRRGRHDEASCALERAMDVAQEIGESQLQAEILLGVGELHRRRGDLDQACSTLLQTLARFRDLDAPHWQARTLELLSSVYETIGDAQAAATARSQAAHLFRTVGSAEA
jgi:DNA-binding SARP family transcriptional activator/tetratricopeptide (TPR) repeat protein